MLGLMFFSTFHIFRSHRLLKPNPKSCCLSPRTLPIMSFLCFITVLFYLTSKDLRGSHHLVSASFITTERNSSDHSFLLTTGTGISLFSTGKSKIELLSDLSHAVHVDFLYLPKLQKTAIFWTDMHEKKIFKSFLEELTYREVLVNHGVSSFGGLAVDRVGSNLYWTDQASGHIEVCRWDGTLRTTLLDQLVTPYGLVIDSTAGLLFWISEAKSEEGRFSVIERCFTDGSQRQSVINLSDGRSNENSYSIAVFPEMQEIYWLDNLTGYLHCSNYEGTGHRVVGQSPKPISSFSLAVTRNSIYWIDHRFLFKVTGSDLEQAKTLAILRPRIYDFKIFGGNHSQPNVINLSCAIHNGGCSHLCLRGVSGPTCLCPYGLQLGSESKTCKDHGPILGFVQEDRGNQISFGEITKPAKWVFPPMEIPFLSNSSLAFDPFDAKMFRIGIENIVQASLNDSTSRVIIKMGYFRPCSLAVDWKHRNLYIMSERELERGLVSLSTLSGYDFSHLHWENIFTPGSLALDVPNMLLFWSHVHPMRNSTALYVLEVSELNGHNRKLFYSSEESVKSMSVDTEGRQLCWLSHHQENAILCKGYGTWSSVYSLQLTATGRVVTAFTFYQRSILYGNDLGQVYSSQLSNLNISSLIMNISSALSFITVVPPKTGVLRKDGCRLDAVCLPNFYGKLESKHNKVDQYLVYTEHGYPHTLSLFMQEEEEEYPELFPHPLFKVGNGDKIAVLPKRNPLYFWVDQKDGTIYSVHRDGRNYSKVITVDKSIGGIEIDFISENLYWSIPAIGEIWVSRLDGRYPFIVYSGNHDHPNILTLNGDYGYLFWSSCAEEECSISRSSLSGLEHRILLNSLPLVADLKVHREMVYWTNPDQGVIERVDVDGQHRTTLLESDKSFSPFSLAVDMDAIYWTDRQYRGGAIMKKMGSSITVLKEAVSAHMLLAVNEDFVPSSRSRNICSDKNGGCSQLCLFSGSTVRNVCHCVHGHASSDSPDCQEYSAFVMFSNQTTVTSARVDNPMDPNPPVQPFSPLTDQAKVVALAYDASKDRIFFNDLYMKPYLYSVHTNGSGLKQELRDSDRTRHIEGLTWDTVAGLLLWTESTSPSLWSLIPGESPNLVMALASDDKPRGIALHSCSRRLFWTNWNLRQPGIESCSLGHCSSTHSSFVTTHSQYTNALTLHGRRLFWSESSVVTKEYSIHSCLLDGTQLMVHARGTDANPFALVVLPDQRILWTDFQNGRLCLVEGSNGCQAVRRGLRKPLGLILVNRSQRMIMGCAEEESLGKVSTETFAYKCLSCNGSSAPHQNISNLVGSGTQFSSFHKNLFIGAGVVGTFLISLTALLLCARCYHHKQHNWCHAKEHSKKEQAWQDKVPPLIRPASRLLLEMDNIACQDTDDKGDDKQSLVSDEDRDTRNVV